MSPSLATDTTRYNDCSPSSASEDEDDSSDPLNHHRGEFNIRVSGANDLETQSPPPERNAFDLHASHEGISFLGQIRATLVASKLNWLLVFVPAGLAAHSLEMNPLLIFITNAIAIVPLSVLLTEATEHIAADAGDTIGALLNITLGNLVELIILVALVNNHIRIVQASILGSVLVNLLLILGSALLASSMSNLDPRSSMEESELLAALLFVSVFVILVPTAFDYTFKLKGKSSEAALSMSRASSLVVLVIYIVYFAYEMRPRKVEVAPIPLQSLHPSYPEHHHRRGQNSMSHSARSIRFADQHVQTRARSTTLDTNDVHRDGIEEEHGKREMTQIGRAEASANLSHRSRSRGHSRSRSLSFDLRDSISSAVYSRPIQERPEIVVHAPHGSSTGGRMAAVTVLFLSSALMSMNAEFLVKTIDDVTHEGGLSEAMIGLIILPVVGNIAEYVTVVTVAMRNKLDLAISVAVGSAIQIALCVAPLTVLIAWMLGRDLEMSFNVFETTTLVGSGLLINLLILSRTGTAIRAIGLKGALMFACYAIIGDDEFKLHQVIVCPQSPVLTAALCGGFQEAKSKTVVVNEFDTCTVKHMISFLYTGEYQISSSSEDEITPDNEEMEPEAAPYTDEAEPDAGSNAEEIEHETDSVSGSSVSSQEEENNNIIDTLLSHLRVNAIADYYDIKGLAQFSNSKIQTILEQGQDADVYLGILPELSTSNRDASLNTIIATSMVDSIDELADSEEFQKMELEHRLAMEIIRACSNQINRLELQLSSAQESHEAATVRNENVAVGTPKSLRTSG
ncbi:hypothetical protein F66182_5777 [Fusarium sp. NRRL 66182]|nr:hypothetical protein F66182_5777 [Fusarium sp. NRRL 66182]